MRGLKNAWVRATTAALAMFVLLLPAGSGSAFGRSTASASVQWEQDAVLEAQLHMPVYRFGPAASAPRGIVVALHGLAFYGRIYERLARSLAERGLTVYATDMRGYGECGPGAGHKYCNTRDCHEKINYRKSCADLVRLTEGLRQHHPDVPIIGLGESMGAAMMIRLAATKPGLVDGLVLSAPAIRKRVTFDPYTLACAGIIAANPLLQLDLEPYIKRYASDDPRVIAEMLEDPLVRKRMSGWELLQSSEAVRKTARYVRGIPANTPVLVVQGNADRCLNTSGVAILQKDLRSTDQTVRWFPERGHILLETAYVKPDTLETVVSWVNSHVEATRLQIVLRRILRLS
jgi:acylglycerol lipase